MYNLEIVFKIVKDAGYKPIIDSYTSRHTYTYHDKKHVKELGGTRLSKEAILFFDTKHEEVIRIQIYKKCCYIGKFSRISNDIFYIKVGNLTSDSLKQHIDNLFTPSSFDELDYERYKLININELKDKELIPIYNIIKTANFEAHFYDIKRCHSNNSTILNFQAILFKYHNQIYEVSAIKTGNTLECIGVSHLGEIPNDEWGLFADLEAKNLNEFLFWLNEKIKINTCDSVAENLKKDIWNHGF